MLTQEQGHCWINHVIGEVLRKKEQLQEDLDGKEPKDNFCPSDKLEDLVKASDLLLVAVDEASGEDVGPEVVSLPKGDVKVYGLCHMIMFIEHMLGV